jgi:hypothetical protein
VCLSLSLSLSHAYTHSIRLLDSDLHSLLYSTVVAVGGNARLPGDKNKIKKKAVGGNARLLTGDKNAQQLKKRSISTLRPRQYNPICNVMRNL